MTLGRTPRGRTPRGRTARPGSRRSRVVWLLAATAACYAVGYPLALLGHSVVGWFLVFLGGPLLLVLGVETVRLVARSPGEPGRPDGAGEDPPG